MIYDRRAQLSTLHDLSGSAMKCRTLAERFDKEFRRKLVEYIETSPYSEEYVLRKLGITAATLRDIKAGLRRPNFSLEELEKL